MSEKTKNVMSGGQAAAEAIKLCKPEVIPVYPITPQTPIVESISQIVADGGLDAEIINVESEHSAMAAAIGAQATGVQAYTATAGQGMALMHEMLFVASGMRLPIVMGVSNRTLSAPLNIWNDQQDSFSERDSGWIQLYVENAQEVFDAHIQAFKIARETETPVMVCMDGFIVSHTYEPIQLLSEDAVRKFLPKHEAKVKLDPSAPVTMGPVATPEYFMRFKKQQQDALEESKNVIKKINQEFASISGRSYGNGLIEKINMENKEHAIITIGSITGSAREIAEKLGVGIIRVRCLRPFPAEDLIEACKSLKSIGVLEKDISLGANGALYDEIKSALYSLENKPKISGYIIGLGGKPISIEDISSIIEKVKDGKEGSEWLM
ncbi:MAG: pyruvate ferredoxin oxidoreductase [Nanoarchaeota archaeon]